MGAKQFKLSTGLTGQAAKRAFEEYQLKAGKAGAINVDGVVRQEGMLVKKYRETKTGAIVTYIRPETVKAKLGRGKRTLTAAQITEALGNLSPADKAALLAQLTA